MHGTCLDCHRHEREQVQRPDLDECGTCHQALQAGL
jgi:hypothetical protein